MSGSWAGGSTRRWRRIRELVFTAKGRECALRLDCCSGWADTVHHTRGRAVTGDDVRYLVPACWACNLTTGDPAAAADPTPEPRTKW